MSVVSDLFAGGVKGVLDTVGSIIGRFKANPDIAAKASADIAVAEAQLQQATLDYEAKLALAQVEVNKIEAASANWFTSNWRPSLGWVCVAGFTYSTIGYPFLFWVSVNYGWRPPPQMDLTVVVQLTFGMLGLGTWRTMDKKWGTTRDAPGSISQK